MRKLLKTILACAAASLTGIASTHAEGAFTHGQGTVTYTQTVNPANGLPIYTFTLNGNRQYVMKSTEAACVNANYDTAMAYLVNNHPSGLKWVINPHKCRDAQGTTVRYTCFVNLDDADEYACAPLAVLKGLKG